VLKLLLIPLFIYVAICLALYLAQGRILFPAPPARPLPPGAERLEVVVPSGERLEGVHLASSQPNKQRLLLLGFGGNGWSGADMAEFLHALYPSGDVVAFHYRGYRPSGGSPSAKALLADAPLVHDYVRKRFAPVRLVGVGFSIGTGVAAGLAGERPLDGLILVTPFDSLASVAASQFRWLPVRLLFSNEIDAASALRRTRAPVALIEAGADELIPHARTDALRGQVPNLVFDTIIEGAGHNDIYRRDELEQAMHRALARVLAPR
jgi:pimeloyl-ACP methyl ester carboxylesterase